MINGLLKLEPKQRLTIPQILSHGWLKETNEDSESDEDEEEENDESNVTGGGGPVANSTIGVNGPGKENKAEKTAGNTTKGGEEVDLKSIGANINFVNVDNLFYEENYGTKLSYTDYCCITEDFTTHHIGI
jgi:hypothetical protein